MTNEEFKKIPFKYDGNGNPVTFGEAGMFFTREERRKIKRLIEKGYSVSEAMNKTRELSTCWLTFFFAGQYIFTTFVIEKHILLLNYEARIQIQNEADGGAATDAVPILRLRALHIQLGP